MIKQAMILAVLMATGSTVAHAQATGAPVPGGAVGSAVANSNRETSAAYNHVVSQMDPTGKPVDKKVGHAVPAKPGDLVAGAPLRDINGHAFAKIESVAPDGVVVSGDRLMVKVPTNAFGKDEYGLLINISEAKLREAISKQHAG
ncbi:hypothetical protein ABDK56_10925 [Sphingomonas sp. ASV193]|uniref:hypothetical protein n=1 Tax=Sphingomonas sp. ASV193 TaxID=3144405 RepID=UPI0032E8D2DA